MGAIPSSEWSHGECESELSEMSEKQKQEAPPLIVDLAFPVTPGVVPLDHGYVLYSALARALPELHQAEWLAVHPLGGRRVGEGALALTAGTRVILRIPADRIPTALPLAGKALQIGGHPFHLGAPTILPLEAAGSVFSRRVAIRLTAVPVTAESQIDLSLFKRAFELEARRQLDKLCGGGTLRVLNKRVLSVKAQSIVTYAVQIDGLNETESLALQARGLGGKRRMGCGVFRRAKRDYGEEA